VNYGKPSADEIYLWMECSRIEMAKQRNIGASDYAAAFSFLHTTLQVPSNPPAANGSAGGIKANIVSRV
jgi:hypothetical protein